jgi:hypothetical protein
MRKNNYKTVQDGLHQVVEGIIKLRGETWDALSMLSYDVIDLEGDVDNPEVSEVIYSNKATIVKFKDGRKSVTKCQPNDTYDKEKGLLFALVKAAYPNWHEIMSEFCWKESE